MNQNKNRLVSWMKFDGDGFMIGGTNTWRPLGVTPRDGGWVRIPGTLSNLCCGVGDSFLIVQNDSTNGNNPGATGVTLTTADNRINFSGTIAQNGGMMVFVIPNGYDEAFTLTMNVAAGGIDLTNSTITGTGVISAASNYIHTGALSATFTTTAAAGSQYLVNLSDD